MKVVTAPLITAMLCCVTGPSGADESVASHRALPGKQAILTDEMRSSARSRMPVARIGELSPDVRALLGIDDSGQETQAHGTVLEQHPFTTKRAAPRKKKLDTIRQQPFAATGKLYIQIFPFTYVCTASVIDLGLLVTAAHCIMDFGTGDWPDEVWFEPARQKNTLPFGTFEWAGAVVPGVWSDGTDVCVGSVQCENDIAIVALRKLNGQHVQDAVGGKYNYKSGNYGYPDFLGLRAGQLTQLGYPLSLDDGVQMIRTDSLGIQISTNNVMWGSDQTGGSSGGPILVNFGVEPSRSDNQEPADNDSNTVVSVVSWGFIDEDIEIQGGSRFRKNTAFTTKANIKVLHDEACLEWPGKCE